MNTRLYNLGKLRQSILVIMSILLISTIIWKLFITKNKIIAKDYLLLASISPDIIIAFQQNKPELWKDYVTVITAGQNLTVESKENLLNTILIQLDRGIDFQELNWYGIDKNIRKSAQYYRTLFDKYSVYTPGKYLFPLAQTCYYIDTYGADREGGLRSHQGTDLFDKKGTPIFSVCQGTVEKLGWNRLGGERVGVRGKDGNYYYYAHLETINQDLFISKEINKGELIGTMGNTGDAITTPVHLHFGIELLNGEWLNPYPLLKVWEYQRFDITAKNEWCYFGLIEKTI